MRKLMALVFLVQSTFRDANVVEDPLVVTGNTFWPLQWDPKRMELASQHLDLLGCKPQSDKLATKCT
jgi:hypothetical protein